jgi:hypothetical protein
MTMKTTTMAYTRIPSYTNKYTRDLADKLWHGCFDKVPTTPIESLRARGVEIRSRYCKAYELETMLVAVCTLSEQMVRHVRSIFDNGKIGYAHTIGIAPWDVSVAQASLNMSSRSRSNATKGTTEYWSRPRAGR